MSKHKNISF